MKYPSSYHGLPRFLPWITVDYQVLGSYHELSSSYHGKYPRTEEL